MLTSHSLGWQVFPSCHLIKVDTQGLESKFSLDPGLQCFSVSAIHLYFHCIQSVTD